MSNTSDTTNESNSVYRRMIFVGLGGSGGKTLRFLKRDLNAWLKTIGWHEGMPQGWQFLQIDTPTVQDGAEIKSAAMLPDNEYLGLVGRDVEMDLLDASLYPLRSAHRMGGSSWRVVPNSLGVNIQTGAGQYRAVGRSVALGYLQAIRARLKKAYEKLNQPEAQASLSKLYMHVHGESPSVNVPAPLVVVVSSIAGGTGAGLINDVCDLLREIDPTAGESIGILFTPDVFSTLSDGDIRTGGIQPNSLAAISEILNGYWWHGGAGGTDVKIPTKKSTLMTAAGAVVDVQRTGPAYPFLVGRKNSSGISYRSSVQLFEIVGAALTSWVTDTTVQQQLIAYAISNWRKDGVQLKVSQHALVNKGSQVLNEFGLNPFCALGFSRVSLGNRYFKNYASERIAREAVQFLVHNFEAGGAAQILRAQQPQISAAELIERQAEERVEPFMRLCGLFPLDENPIQPKATDPFVEAESLIRPEELDIFYYECLDVAVTQVSHPAEYVSSDWISWIIPAVSDAALQFEQKCAPRVEENLVKWVESQPDAVLSHVITLIGEVGIQVAEAVIDKMVKRITSPNDGVITRLKELTVDLAFYAQQGYWGDLVKTAYVGKTKKIPAGALARQACDSALTAAVYASGIRMKQVTIDLLEQFVQGFLIPLQQTLAADMINQSRQVAKVSDWPNWPEHGSRGSLSDASTPPMSEYTVINHQKFPEIFDELLSMTIPGLAGQDEMRRHHVRSEVLRGEFLEAKGNQDPRDIEKLNRLRPIRISSVWWPNISQHLSAPRTVSTVSFAVGLDAASIQGRALEWLDLNDTPFKRLSDSSLRSYLDPRDSKNIGVNAGVFKERQASFLAQFQTAISASQPLVELDTQLMAVMYPGESHPKLAIEVSSLPFKGHDLEEVLSDELLKLKGDENVASYFKPDRQINHIDITSRLSGPYPVFAISSLLMPIAQSWQALSDEDRADFWDKRRARPLNEFIPAPQEHILCMLRGWFIGRCLGLVAKSARIEEGGTFYVAPRGKNPGLTNMELPKKFLSHSQEWGDEPALALESLGLAYVQVGVENTFEPLAGYINLLELGRSGNGAEESELTDYRELADFVTRWIDSGDVSLESEFKPSEPPVLTEDLTTDSTPQDRQRVLRETLQAIRKEYGLAFDRYKEQAAVSLNVLSLPPYWPSMYWLIDTALGQLVEKLVASSGETTVQKRQNSKFLPQ
jgi:hypothetical protein